MMQDKILSEDPIKVIKTMSLAAKTDKDLIFDRDLFREASLIAQETSSMFLNEYKMDEIRQMIEDIVNQPTW